MYLLTQLWLLLGVALALGVAAGFAVKRVLVHRRLQAVQHGAYVEQQAQLARMDRLVEEHRQAMSDQADALFRSLDDAHAQRIDSLQGEHGAELTALQTQARRDMTALVRAHDEVQAETRVALQRALENLAAETSVKQLCQAELSALQAELAMLRERMAEAIDRHERALADVVAKAQAQNQAQLQAQAQAYEQMLAMQRETMAQVQGQQTEEALRLQQEAAKLREQLDVMLIELSAAARARDAREAQRAQLAQQLAIETAARRREAEIASAQRDQLRLRVVSLQHDASDQQATLRAQCDELMNQLLVSRRTTQAAVLAARQREARLDAELNRLRAMLGEPVEAEPMLEAGASATVHELVRVA